MAKQFIAVSSAALAGRVVSSAAGAALTDGERLLRDGLFLATVLLIYFTVSPFPNLSDPQLLQPKLQGDLLGQVTALLLTGSLAAFAFFNRLALLRSVVTLPLVLTLLAFGISALLSAYPDVAGRRLLLSTFTIFQASMVLLLPYGREHFARLLAVAAVVVLAACFVGVALAPQLSIHQASDIAEPELAGDWRGIFAHKNGAGATMVQLIFIGIFICRVWNRLAGFFIIGAAAVFLYFTHSKSPLNLFPIVLLVSYLLPRLRGATTAFALLAAVPILLNLITVGSVVFAPVMNLLSSVMADPTFTGRSEIWQFALDRVAERPLFGFGFETFWQTPDLLAAWNYLESWGLRASDAHNGYLNLAVTTGLVGLTLALWWIVIQPFRDFRHALALGADRPLTMLLLQFWLFGLCVSGFESELFKGGSEVWFFIVVAIVGLRFQTIARSAE